MEGAGGQDSGASRTAGTSQIGSTTGHNSRAAAVASHTSSFSFSPSGAGELVQDDASLRVHPSMPSSNSFAPLDEFLESLGAGALLARLRFGDTGALDPTILADFGSGKALFVVACLSSLIVAYRRVLVRLFAVFRRLSSLTVALWSAYLPFIVVYWWFLLRSFAVF